MDADRELDAHLARATDELLSIASLGAAGGRPELALRASAALDELLGFPVPGPVPAGAGTRPDLSGDPAHARH